MKRRSGRNKPWTILWIEWHILYSNTKTEYRFIRIYINDGRGKNIGAAIGPANQYARYHKHLYHCHSSNLLFDDHPIRDELVRVLRLINLHQHEYLPSFFGIPLHIHHRQGLPEPRTCGGWLILIDHYCLLTSPPSEMIQDETTGPSNDYISFLRASHLIEK